MCCFLPSSSLRRKFPYSQLFWSAFSAFGPELLRMRTLFTHWLWHTMPSWLGIMRLDFLCFQKWPFEIFPPTPPMYLPETCMKDKWFLQFYIRIMNQMLCKETEFVLTTFWLCWAAALFFPLKQLKLRINFCSQGWTKYLGNFD